MSRSHARKGAAIGAVVAVAFAAYATYAGARVGIPSPTFEPHYLKRIAIGAVVGTTLGGAIGSASRRWETVYP